MKTQKQKHQYPKSKSNLVPPQNFKFTAHPSWLTPQAS